MKETSSPLKDFYLILSCVLGSCVLFIAFLKIANLFILLAIILAVVGVIYLFSKAGGIRDPIVQAFKRRRVFSFCTIMVLIVLLPVILRSSPYWIFISPGFFPRCYDKCLVARAPYCQCSA